MMEIRSYWTSRKELVDRRVKEIIDSMDVDPEIREIMSYAAFGGKRLRGTLTLLFAEALGSKIENALDASVAIEFVHAASLVHDDIIDGDVVRRGKPTTWLRYGISKAIIVPHILISKAQMLVEKYGMDAILLTVNAWYNVSLGEYEDIVRGAYYNPEAYRRIALLKTGALFGAAAALGAIVAKADKDIVKEAMEYGVKLGVAFQVADDIVDLYLFLKGKLNLRSSPSLNSFIAWILEGKPYGDSIGSEVMSKAIEKLRMCIGEVVRVTEKLVDVFEHSKLMGIIKELPRYAAVKMLEEGGLTNYISTLMHHH